ncbi:MAG: ABC transporter permease, partial [Bacteroidetes bacterium]
MWKHYALIALRNMRRQYGYSLINIIGLSTGLAVCLLIWMYVQDERGYDQHHPDGDRIFRLVTYWQQNGAWIGTAQSSYRMRPELEAADFPQVEAMARFDPSFVRLEYEGNTYEEGQVAMMDPEALDIFHIPLRSGDPAKVLADPFTAIMSTDMARRYFGDDDPVGKVLRVNDMADLVITGVMDPMPEKSHFHFDMLVSLKTGPVIYPDIVLNNLGEMSQVTYLKLKRPEDKEALEAQFPAFAERLLGEEAPGMIRFELQPIHDIHLHSQLQGEIEPNGNIRYLYIFGTVALFILLIACINYMNLATARAGRRMREVGLRKVVGARRTQLIGQFLAESVVISLFATLLALVWADLFLPMFNQLAGKELAFSHLPGGAWLTLLGFGLLVGFLAGSYPAFVLSGFRPVQILRGRGHDLQLGGLGLRRGLVVVQFAISIILIISTLTVSSQLNYLRNKDLGLNTEQLVIMPLPTDSAARDYPGLKNRLLADPNIVSVTASNKRLTRRLSSILGHEVQGVTLNQESGAIRTVTVDHDFFRTMDVDMVAGRDFSRGYGTDGTSAFIFNETAIRLMGLTPEEALGRQVETSTLSAQKAWIPRKGQIVGVAKDFHFESLENKIVPV